MPLPQTFPPCLSYRCVSRALLLLALMTSVSCMSAQAPPARSATDEQKLLLELDRNIQRAMVTSDTKLLEEALAPDLVFTHGWLSGGQQSRADLIEQSRRPTSPYFSRDVSQQIVELHGDIALVLGRLDVRRRPIERNQETEPQCYALLYVHLYEHRDGRWLFASHRTAQHVDERRPCP